jgi:hypothetical protein
VRSDGLADGDGGGGEAEVEDDDGGLRPVIRRSLPWPFIQELARSTGQRRAAWMEAGMPVQAIRAAAAMSFWWLVRHTG